LPAAPLPEGGLREAVDDYQRQLIEACLQRHQENWAAAARELGLDRANLSRLARRLGLR
jgi:anaerobic nitric oxide reductase transcription regulator